MAKQITIIGGGISGLATLHFLKKRFKDDVDIQLFESNGFVGGNIQTVKHDGFLFETGPNGFLNNSPTTMELVEDLRLVDQLIEADTKAKRRYIQLKGQLNLLPMGFVPFIRTPILTFPQKLRLLQGLYRKNISNDCSVHDYVSRRFGRAVAENLVDPFMRGIYAGDIRRLHMAHAFPKMKKGAMTSFKGGMGTLIQALEKKYQDCIHTGHKIASVEDLKADLIISTVPAYEASSLTKNVSLNEVRYCAVSVVGLGFKANTLKQKPDGFGYLIPSSQGKEILGVLIESNVYEHRAPNDSIMFRAMVSGVGTGADLIGKAVKEIDMIYGINQEPIFTKVQSWPKAIPQYELNYPHVLNRIQIMDKRLQLSGNYLKGISFNDCINNAKGIVNAINL